MTTIQVEKSEIKQLSDKIDDIASKALEASEAAKASAAIAYQASVENVKSNKSIENKLDAYIKEDMTWKDRAEPVIEMGENAQGASKVVLYLTAIIGAIGGAYLMIKNIFK